MAIVGPSGSGKSTIAQLIQEHYDPVDGAVYLDGIDIRNLDLGWLRKHVGVVSQEPVLFSGSVEHNIKSGLTNATTKEVVEAAKLANAHEFIKHLPEGYQTWLGEGGASISGGQKQRVAIARALIRQPQILLLDESTSALDSYSERLVLAAMEKVRRGRTIIMIAHRLSTVRNADRIIVIDRGQIKEMGTHEELLLLNGIYAEMLSQSVS
uniref:ABC transporter domain-containing protein n=1 Tax=Mesocestoides corti TaxID=53468 RepID=A0A5K3F7R6_MESCO